MAIILVCSVPSTEWGALTGVSGSAPGEAALTAFAAACEGALHKNRKLTLAVDTVQKPARVAAGSCAGDALGKGSHCPLSQCLKEKGLVERHQRLARATGFLQHLC